jgi:hypothetical protein
VKLGFHFPGDPDTEKVRSDFQTDIRGGRTFLDGFGAKKLYHQKALIFMYDKSDIFHL